jgi:hypothetical protein
MPLGSGACTQLGCRLCTAAAVGYLGFQHYSAVADLKTGLYARPAAESESWTTRTRKQVCECGTTNLCLAGALSLSVARAVSDMMTQRELAKPAAGAARNGDGRGESSRNSGFPSSHRARAHGRL